MFKAWLYFEKSDSLDFEEKVTGRTTLGFLTWYVGFLYFERRPFDVFYCLEIAHLFLQTPSGLKKTSKWIFAGCPGTVPIWEFHWPRGHPGTYFGTSWTLSLILKVQGTKPWGLVKRPNPGNHETSERALLPISKAVIDNAKNKMQFIKFILFQWCLKWRSSLTYLYKIQISQINY